ncbi:Z1 domain-containing protein [Kineococcus sp. GCM10028916]|uniref:Z1 domain-containing protein n=1 Tax=Kineococcus sp. GCM10028916 TaxID=3273394 RepID=UPI0036D365C1
MVSEIEEFADDIERFVRTGSTIEGAIARYLRLNIPAEKLEEARILYERRVGRIRTLVSPPAIVSPDRRVDGWYGGPRESDVFWPHLHSVLVNGLDDEAMVSVDEASTRITGLLTSPGSTRIRTRGLVLGYVQSGKTTSFMSVIAKAADAGYRVFIVLSGMTDNLRSQTQDRLESSLVKGLEDRWFRLTTLEDDFQSPDNAAFLLGAPGNRLLAVVKKNPHRLRRLLEWLQSAGSVIEDCPVLIVDDEADQASIDVGSGGRRSQINQLIREILDLPKVAYVAYSATPFANLLIDPNDDVDLFPRDFIVDLPRPAAYFGPERLFGRQSLDEDDEEVLGLDVVRPIPEVEVAAVRPPAGRGAADGWSPDFPDSLTDALCWFLLATAARRVRGRGNPHSSMLIHTSMLSSAHEAMAEPVRTNLASLGASLETPEVRAFLKDLWEDEASRVSAAELGETPVSFMELWERLPEVVASTEVVVDNYLSDARLSYDRDNPTTVVVIGGNTLSRGLTLEGLVSSYFVRTAKAYDTVLQMGRWFGYRNHYQDLPRVWMTDELQEWFRDLAFVEEEIRREIARFELSGSSEPRDLRVPIRSHPLMAITSAAKMRAAVPVRASFGDQRRQTILFDHLDKLWLDRNIEAAATLVSSAEQAGATFHAQAPSGRRLLTGVPAACILTFLDKYKFHPGASDVRGDVMSSYIRRQNSYNALQEWSVAIIEGGSGVEFTLSSPSGRWNGLRMVNRSRTAEPQAYANIKALVSRRDRLADVPLSAEEIAERLRSHPRAVPRITPELEEVVYRAIRNETMGSRGLVCLYPINPNSQPGGPAGRTTKAAPAVRTSRQEKEERVPLGAAAPVMGVALFFPTAEGPDPEVSYVIAPPLADVDGQLGDVYAQMADEVRLADRRDEERSAAQGDVSD